MNVYFILLYVFYTLFCISQRGTAQVCDLFTYSHIIFLLSFHRLDSPLDSVVLFLLYIFLENVQI